MSLGTHCLPANTTDDVYLIGQSKIISFLKIIQANLAQNGTEKINIANCCAALSNEGFLNYGNQPSAGNQH